MTGGRDDKDKTVIGGSLGGPPAPNPLPGGPGGRPRPAPGGERTVIGGALPGGAAGGGGFGGGGFGSEADAWTTGGGAPAPSGGFGGQGFGGQPFGAPPQPGAAPPVAGAFAPSDSFFPDHRAAAAAAAQPAAAPARKIDLALALRGTGLGNGGPTNPILAAAANLLILLGRLRTQMVEMDARPLMEHVTREIDLFEQNVLAAGVDPHEAQVAKYMLCGTADDIVQNIPGNDRHLWVQYSMVARFFNVRTSGVGFFQELEKALMAPAQRYRLLELGLVCLSLGFEGQYRTMPNGSTELQRIRNMVHDSLRRVQSRPDDDLSPRWQPVILGRRRKFGGTPVWVVGAVLGVALLGVYLGLSMLISNEGHAVATRLMTVHPTAQVTLQREVVFTPVIPEAPPPRGSQVDRLRELMAPEVEAGLVDLTRKGDFIVLRINNTVLFDSGRADAKAEFAPLAAKIAAALDEEPGPVRVQGFTDNVPLSGRGRFKNNFELSVARAESVKAMLATTLSDPTRLEVEGRGEADPIADNATAEGRAQNRRVEILLTREEVL